MKTNLIKNLVIGVIPLLLVGCAGGGITLTKQEAFPAMYDSGKRPVSILVVPALNKSTAADAPDLYSVTVAEQLSRAGYYVYPLEVVTDILRNEGVVDTQMIRNLPATAFKEGFGADAVLFVTINAWDTNYAVISGNVNVALDFVMYSTTTNEILWNYSANAVVNTSGDSSGNILADMLVTAIMTAMTSYTSVAKQANAQALVALPVGPYNSSYGTDGAEKVVSSNAKDNALLPQAE